VRIGDARSGEEREGEKRGGEEQRGEFHGPSLRGYPNLRAPARFFAHLDTLIV
jgi:hypothetical protein